MGRSLQRARSLVRQIALISLITLALGEIALRTYDHFFPSFIFYNSSYNRFRGGPFADEWNFQLNSLGFKDVEFHPKQPSVYRMLGIGDSFAFGVVPYEFNYLTLLESQLQEGNAKVELLNMGIPAIGPKEYLSLLVNEGLSLDPDMVLVSFFVGNDFIYTRKRRLHDYSHAASLLRYVISLRYKYEGRTIHGNGEYCDTCPRFDRDQYLQIEYDRSSIYLVANETFRDQLASALYYLEEIQNICKGLGIDLVVAIIPDELQANQDLERELRTTYYPDIEDGQWDIALPNEMLAKELRALGIDHLDLFEHFRGSGERLYKPRDTHWNIAGNQLAADVIQAHVGSYLASRGAIGGSKSKLID